MIPYVATVLLGLCITPAASRAQELIHSDVPLWGIDSDKIWPRNFYDEASFGCAHRMTMGDWKLERPDEQVSYKRFTNYGAIHCRMIEQSADTRRHLKTSDGLPSFVVELGRVDTATGQRDLWAIQLGARPGSDYLLLASAVAPGVPDTYDVLQRECPPGHERAGPSLDIVSTDYCAINSQAELTALARRMATLPPAGRLVLVEGSK